MIKKIPNDLLEVLACPSCKADLEYQEQQEKLICHNCKLAYPIKEGVPIMIIEDAQRL
jgi:hypothetical protein